MYKYKQFNIYKMKYFLSVVAIFKNEGHIINEWIWHYILEGVNHFYLIDNASDDGYIIDPAFRPFVDIVIDPTRHQQIKLYNIHFLNKIKDESEWIMLVDLDEFLYSRKSYNTITEVLNDIKPNIEQITIPHKVFGSSGNIYQPKSTIRDFIYRNDYSVPTMVATKSIARTKYLISLDLHFQITQTKVMLYVNKVKTANSIAQLTDEHLIECSPIGFNHYVIQSFEFYRKVKMTRGDNLIKSKDNMRDAKYFTEQDSHSNVLDDELKHKRFGFDTFPTKLPDIKVYGCEIYIDVSTIEIDESKKFNDIFGDPIPNKKKFYIVRHNNRLEVYDER